MVDLVKRHGFPLAAVVSLALHGAVALYAVGPEVVHVRLAPFRHGKTTVALRPTVVEQSRPDPLPEKVVRRDALADAVTAEVSRRLTHPRWDEAAMRSEPKQADPRLDSVAADVPRQAELEISVASPHTPGKTIRDPLAVVAEQAQPLMSRLNEGSKNGEQTAKHLPHPPFPSNRPIRPALITISCIIGADGRFYEVTAETGDAEWDRFLKEFIEQRWWATPQRRGGVPVASAKSYKLNYYQPQ
jgi:hypothetical protein